MRADAERWGLDPDRYVDIETRYEQDQEEHRKRCKEEMEALSLSRYLKHLAVAQRAPRGKAARLAFRSEWQREFWRIEHEFEQAWKTTEGHWFSADLKSQSIRNEAVDQIRDRG